MQSHPVNVSFVQQALLGDEQAFGQLVREHQSMVYSVCRSIVRNHHDAEEVMQDVFVQAYQKLSQLKEPNKFSQWLLRIAQNRSRSFLRYQKRHSLPIESGNFTPVVENSPEESILRQELVDAVKEAIESLPHKDRQIIKAHIDGLKPDEIHQATGLSYRAVISRLYRARRKIMEKVEHLLQFLGWLPKGLLDKILVGGLNIMTIGKTATVVATLICVGGIATFVGIKSMTRKPDVKTQKPLIAEQTRILANSATPKRKITATRFVAHKPSKVTKALDVETPQTEEIPKPEEVPTAKNSDDEIRAFLDWLLSFEKEDASDKTEIDNSDVADEHELEKIDYDREKSLVESVLLDKYKRGYETYDVELYMSSIWEDDFFYTADNGTPDDPSDDIVYRGGQKEREGAIRVFNAFSKNITLNLSPKSDIEFLSDTVAMVEYDYEAKFSQPPSPGSKFETFVCLGTMILILENRENPAGIGEWRILEWYDYAKK
jgi:RNA polymerase sigma-70 factor (ECF subfamily)